MAKLEALLAEIRACRICAGHLPDGVRPVLRASLTAKICIVGQAPGIRVHNTGIPFNDPSGERLRDWMGVDRETFYDESRIAILPMGFCFPGYDAKGADKPPRKECARHWRAQLFEALPGFPLTLVIGTYAQHWHLAGRTKQNVSETVRAWRDYTPRMIPLPHPSWRNNAWLKKNPWFQDELLPYLRGRVRRLLASR
ncbi:MAG: uracil-DNA glycosylase family protein [Alphaproteobacteria bacterium]|nr:uracil-DNA glycosylase family protein [Alphaproteobacteria bacterium]